MSEREQDSRPKVTGRSTTITVDGFPLALEIGQELRRAFEARPHDDELAHDIGGMLDRLREDHPASERLIDLLGGRVVRSADGKWVLETFSAEQVSDSISTVERNHEFAHHREIAGSVDYPDARESVMAVMAGNVGRAANREGVDPDVAPGSVVDPALEEELLNQLAGRPDGAPRETYVADGAGNLSVVLVDGPNFTRTARFSAEEIADWPELQRALASGDEGLALRALRAAATNRSSERNLALSKPEYF